MICIIVIFMQPSYQEEKSLFSHRLVFIGTKCYSWTLKTTNKKSQTTKAEPDFIWYLLLIIFVLVFPVEECDCSYQQKNDDG